MGLGRVDVDAILREAGRRRYSGNAYVFGRQSIQITPARMIKLFAEFDLECKITDPSQLHVDRSTSSAINNPSAEMIQDTDFFSMLGLTEYHAIDVSDFEGADIIANLNQPLPPELEGACSGILVDGSLLDNIFDPVTGLKNAARLLRAGARCFLDNVSNTIATYPGLPYLCLLPIWFFDYIVWNQFEYCQVYVVVYPKEPGWPDVYTISLEHAAKHRGSGGIFPILSDRLTSIVVYAEKGATSTWDKTPTQSEYRNENDWARYIGIVEGWLAQNRPHLIHGLSRPIDYHVPAGYIRILEDRTAIYMG